MTTTTLSPSDGVRDARASGHPLPPEGGHCLSIVHKTRSSKTNQSTARLFQVWKDGSLASFPAIPNLDPKAENSAVNRGGIRGKVVTLSEASRRNLMLYLAKLNRDTQEYTMALTLPGDLQFLTSAKVHLCFRKLCDRFTASNIFPKVGFVWKRELQRRGALHYHLLLHGLENEETRRAFQSWISNQWNALVCVGLSDVEKEKHLRWHLHGKNMEAKRSNIARYFAKYLGKALESVREEIPGRWWGKVNAKALQISKCTDLILPPRAAVIAHRIARKILQKRSNEAKHFKTARDIGMLDYDGKPHLSQFGILAAKERPQSDEHRFWIFMQKLAKHKGKSLGKARKPRIGKLGRIRLISNNSPETALQIMRYVGDALKDWFERNPF